MKKEHLLIQTQVERDYSKRQVKDEIKILREVLDRIERRVESNDVRADDSFQGNEWRLYKELSNLERLNGFLEDIKNLEEEEN